MKFHAARGQDQSDDGFLQFRKKLAEFLLELETGYSQSTHVIVEPASGSLLIFASTAPCQQQRKVRVRRESLCMAAAIIVCVLVICVKRKVIA